MPEPDLDFPKIRALRGSRATGFEELCCELAGLEPAPAGSRFRRKGEGADAGLEAFLKLANGDEVGWQAKYFFSFGDVQVAQLDKSLDAALAKHPHLKTFVVCMPIDLRDARIGKAKSEAERFDAWRTKAIGAARTLKRTLKVELWDRNALTRKLTIDEPARSGLRLYWFDDRQFGTAWFEDCLTSPLVELGERYQAENDVELQISRALEGLARSRSILESAHAFADRLERAQDRARVKPADAAAAGVVQPAAAFDAAATQLVEALAQDPVTLTEPVPVGTWRQLGDDVVRALDPVLHAASQPTAPETLREARGGLWELRSAVDDLLDAVQASPWTLVNASRLLLTGEAGIGKSHLLAGFVQSRVRAGCPALLALTGSLVEGDPWRQLLEQWDLASLSREQFLGALSAAAEASGECAVLVIDALNEGHGLALWRTRLRSFLDSFADYPRIAVIVSCRTIYLPALRLDKAVPELERLAHPGFSDESDDAATRYLEKRGVTLPGAPNLASEFDNPLFLKTCCDLLDRKGERSFPRGLHGVTAVFNFYAEAVAEALDARMGLDPLQSIPARAIAALAQALTATPGGRLSLAEAGQVLERVHPSHGMADRSLLRQLVSEGLLTIEVEGRGTAANEVVRFTFERFSDHAIARRLLDQHLLPGDPVGSFASGPLAETTIGLDNDEWAGVVEALAIQLPERCGVELPDVSPAAADDFVVRAGFRRSLLWRDQSRFTARTLELVGDPSTPGGLRAQIQVLLRIATEPDNAFNARHLDARLRAMARPDRDAVWSTLIAGDDLSQGGAVSTLVNWSWAGAPLAEPDRVELAATVLCWLFTTSHRAVRDRATKALAAMLKNRLRLAANLVERFAPVDDLYVIERVLAAAYGAALQSPGDPQLSQLAGAAWTTVFAAGAPPPHLLLRDYAAGILLFSAQAGAAPSGADLKVLNGPFPSPWPLEAVSETHLEPYTRFEKGEPYSGAINTSCSDHGDFGRYVIDKQCHRWSLRPVSEAGLTTENLRDRWIEGLVDWGSAEMVEAYVAFCVAAFEVQRTRAGWKATEEEEARAAEVRAAASHAAKAFTALLPPERLADWNAGLSDLVQTHYEGGVSRFQTLPEAAVRRWVAFRAYGLGWTAERFESFERGGKITHDRMTHRVERVGKKYQWLALHEACARAADHVAPIRSYASDTLGTFDGAWSTDLRDVDPTAQARAQYETADAFWWCPLQPKLKAGTGAEVLAWKDSEADLISGPSLLEVTRPVDSQRFYVLDSFYSWRGRERGGKSALAVPETWARVTALVVRKRQRAALLRSLQGRHWLGSHELPEYDSVLHGFVGEHPWREPFADMESWLEPGRGGLTVPVRRCAFEYVSERLGYDYSIDGDIRCQLPAPWLIESLGLQLVDGTRFIYQDRDGGAVCYDPSMTEPGWSAAVVDRTSFDAMLERENLAAVWVISGEKNAYGTGLARDGFGGRRVHTAVLHQESGRWRESHHETKNEPSVEQLKALLGPAEKIKSESSQLNTKRSPKPGD